MLGLAGGLILVLPASTFLIWRSLASGQMTLMTLIISSALLIPALLLALPVLFLLAEFFPNPQYIFDRGYRLELLVVPHPFE